MAEPTVYVSPEQQNTAYPLPGSYPPPHLAPSYPQCQPGNTDPVHTVDRQGGCCGSGISEHYNAKAGFATGVVHLVVAVLSIILGGVSYLFALFQVGYGIWSAIIIYLPTGIVGLASKNKNSCVVVAYMIMSILTSLYAIGMVVYEAFVAAIQTYNSFCYRPSYYSSYICYSERIMGGVVIHSLLALVGLVELINTIVAAVYCCKGHSACCAPPPTNQGAVNTPTVVYNNVTSS